MHKHEATGVADAVIVAAGSGARFGDPVPKQFHPLGGRPMLAWSVEALLASPRIRTVVVVHAPGYASTIEALLAPYPQVRSVVGGAVRAASVRAGLAALAEDRPAAVLIHDAARPGLSGAVIDELLQALERADAAAPALPLMDALKRRSPDGALASVDRADLFRVQTPQAFRYGVIAQAHAAVDGDFPDDLALVEAQGARVVLTPGRAELMKVTEPGDLALLEAILGRGRMGAMRVGTGFDVHAFAPARPVDIDPADASAFVTLCGVRIPHSHPLEGHSDADVAWHAVTDAVLGAAALGDIGDHFPPSDPQWKGAASIRFLQHAVRLAGEKGLSVVNVDVTVICERPRIGPHREAMRRSTAEAMGLPLDAVSIKATTTEKLGFTGRSEGIAAQAAVLLTGP